MSELALKLIRENKAKHARGEDASFLDLGNCGIIELPEELFECVWVRNLNLGSWGNDQQGKWTASANTGEKNSFTTLPAAMARLQQLEALSLQSTHVSDLSPLSGLTALQSLGVSNTQVSDLSPLSGLTLQMLNVSGTEVSKLSPLSGLTALKTLDVRYTEVSDLSPLSGLTSLQSLDVSSTQVSDLLHLSGLTSLQSLDVSSTQVSDLLHLSGLKALQSLSISYTKVSDLSPLSSLKMLQTLSISYTKINDLSPLPDLKVLQNLYIKNTQVSDLSHLSGLKALQSLEASGTQVSDLSPLSGLTALQSLNVWGTRVSDLSPLSGLTALQSLIVSETNASDLLPLSGLTALQSLNVSGTQVSDLSHLSGLKALQSLEASGTQVSDLSPLSGLTALQSLNVWGTRVSDLSPLSGLKALQSLHVAGTQVSDLSPLSGLTALQSLNVWGTRVSDLSPLSGLKALQRLYGHSTPLRDLSPLSGLMALQTLNVFNTQVSDLSPLSGLMALQSLDVWGTQVSDLSPLSGLTALQSLNVWDTKVSDLSPLLGLIAVGRSVEWSISYGLPGIYVKGCPLSNPPVEIVQQGNEAILRYWELWGEEEMIPLPELRLILCGNGNAGKTDLSLWLQDKPLQTKRNPTHGILHETWQPKSRELKAENARVHLWDFGGQEYYYATHQLFFRQKALYVLLWETATNHFAQNPEKRTEDSQPLDYWLTTIGYLTKDNAQTLVVQNKIDTGAGEQYLNQEELKRKSPHIQAFHAISLTQGVHTKWLKERIEMELETLLKRNQSGGFKRSLHETREFWQEKSQPYFTKYDALLAEFIKGKNQKKESLIQGFHDFLIALDTSGAILYYHDQEALKNWVILKPEGLLQRIYGDILSEKVLKDGTGVLPDLTQIIPDADEWQMLLAIMQHFKLIFQVGNGDYVATQYLPTALPKELQAFVRFSDARIRFWVNDFLYYRLKLALFAEYGQKQDSVAYFWRNGLLISEKNEQTDSIVMLSFQDKDKQVLLHQQHAGKVNPCAKSIIKFIEKMIENDIRFLQRLPPLTAKEERLLAAYKQYRASLTAGQRLMGDHHLEEREQKFNTLRKRDLVQEVCATGTEWVPIEAIRAASRAKQVAFSVGEKLYYVSDFRDFLSDEERRNMPMKKVFISYSKSDEDLRRQLDAHLSRMKREGILDTWHDRKLIPGEEWDKRIRKELEEADIILLLLSSDAINTDYIYDIEIKRALERHDKGEAVVIPIILRHCDWQIEDISKLVALPQKAHPILSEYWKYIDEAFLNVAKGIRITAEKGLSGLQEFHST